MNQVRRMFLLTAGAVLAAPRVATAQSTGRSHRIGWLNTAVPGSRDSAFLEGLRALGYMEGQNVLVEWRWAEGRFDRLPRMAAELVRLKVDVMVVGGTPAALAAQRATDEIPIVMVVAADPVAAGLVASLGRPAGNITGITSVSQELAGKRLQLLKEALPKLSSLAILWHDKSNPFTAATLKDTGVAAAAANLRMHSVELRRSSDIEDAFTAMSRERVGAVIVVQDGFALSHRTQLLGLAARHRLPAMWETRAWAAAGGLMAFGPDDADLHRLAATFVDKIFKGAKPADLPIEQPTKLDLALNLGTAKALGIKFPQSVLVRADQVIE